MSLDPAFLETPLAHRGLHGPGRAENGPGAIAAAVESGYGVEIDVQLSADGVAVVFHDPTLDRMTSEVGPVSDRSAADLAAIPLNGGGGTIPALWDVLRIVDGAVPLLVEIKDRTAALDGTDGKLERAVASALTGYDGPVAVMSFNPFSVGAMSGLAPGISRGLTTCAFDPLIWDLPEETCARLRAMEEFDAVDASFISHDHADLASPAVRRRKRAGIPILCWTIRSPAEAIAALKVADTITFEGYLPG